MSTTVSPARWYPATLMAATLTCALAPAYTVRWHIGPLPTTVLENAILVTVALFLVETYRGPRRLEWRTPFTFAALLFMLAGAIAIVAAPDSRGALGLYRAYLIEPIAFFFVVSTVARTSMRALLLALGLGVGAVGLAIPNAWVVLQALRHHTLHVESQTPVVVYLTANAVAMFLEPLIAMGASVALFYRDRTVRLISLAVLAIIVPTEVLTLSRGGYLTLAAITVGLALAHRYRWWLLAAGAAAAIALSRIPSISQRLAVEIDFNNGSNTLVGRLMLWSATLRMLKDHPIFGSGLAGFTERLGPYWNGTHIDRFIDPHNIVLNFWTETGLLGIFAFGWIMAAAFMVSWKGWKGGTPAWRPIHLGVLVAMVALVVHGLIDVPYFKNDLSLEFWTMLGMTWAGTRWVSSSARPAPARTPASSAVPSSPS